MHNNIFIKQSKTKYNPDIKEKLDCKSTEREQSKFELNKIIYNSITGIIPDKDIEKPSDLYLQKDKEKENLKLLILNKQKERSHQDVQFMPVKIKVINGDGFNNSTSDNTSDNTSNEYLKTYNDMKQSNEKSKQQLNQAVHKTNYNNILIGLEELGILK